MFRASGNLSFSANAKIPRSRVQTTSAGTITRTPLSVNSLTYPSTCDQNPNNDLPQTRVELTPQNINSWWLHNQPRQLQRGVGEDTTPNHADVSDKVNQQLQLKVGDVVWCARRSALPEVSKSYLASLVSHHVPGLKFFFLPCSFSSPPSLSDPVHLTILLTSIFPNE
jgi:hypothetical protein